MKILYIAKHGQQDSADDEGAIAYALQQLGHEVFCATEDDTKHIRYHAPRTDLLLFHKWQDDACLRHCETKIKAFWYFDRVVGWHPKRWQWIERTIPLVDIGFCTDGDLVHDWGSSCTLEGDKNKLVWLPQGADERIVGRGTPDPSQAVDVLCMAGTRFHGAQRQSFVRDLEEFCAAGGFSFRHVEEGVYREQLRDLVASAKVVVAPDSPVSDRYCSNRIFNMLGFGAYLLHPRCEAVKKWYEETFEVSLYENWEELKIKLTFVVTEHQGQAFYRGLKEHALARTLKDNLYRHRCERLTQVVQERCKA